MTEGPEPPRKATRAYADRLFGYDVFISYARADASSYASDIHSKLEALGYRCFLDRGEALIGEQLSVALERRLRRSRALVVIVSDLSLRSTFVVEEVRYYAKLGRDLIPVEIGDVFDRLNEPLIELVQKYVRIKEPVGATTPSSVTLGELRNRLSFTRTNEQFQRVLIGLASFFAVLAFGAILAAYLAIDAKTDADARRIEAIAARDRAEKMQALATQRRVEAESSAKIAMERTEASLRARMRAIALLSFPGADPETPHEAVIALSRPPYSHDDDAKRIRDFWAQRLLPAGVQASRPAPEVINWRGRSYFVRPGNPPLLLGPEAMKWVWDSNEQRLLTYGIDSVVSIYNADATLIASTTLTSLEDFVLPFSGAGGYVLRGSTFGGGLADFRKLRHLVGIDVARNQIHRFEHNRLLWAVAIGECTEYLVQDGRKIVFSSNGSSPQFSEVHVATSTMPPVAPVPDQVFSRCPASLLLRVPETFRFPATIDESALWKAYGRELPETLPAYGHAPETGYGPAAVLLRSLDKSLIGEMERGAIEFLVEKEEEDNLGRPFSRQWIRHVVGGRQFVIFTDGGMTLGFVYLVEHDTRRALTANVIGSTSQAIVSVHGRFVFISDLPSESTTSLIVVDLLRGAPISIDAMPKFRPRGVTFNERGDRVAFQSGDEVWFARISPRGMVRESSWRMPEGLRTAWLARFCSEDLLVLSNPTASIGINARTGLSAWELRDIFAETEPLEMECDEESGILASFNSSRIQVFESSRGVALSDAVSFADLDSVVKKGTPSPDTPNPCAQIRRSEAAGHIDFCVKNGGALDTDMADRAADKAIEIVTENFKVKELSFEELYQRVHAELFDSSGNYLYEQRREQLPCESMNPWLAVRASRPAPSVAVEGRTVHVCVGGQRVTRPAPRVLAARDAIESLTGLSVPLATPLDLYPGSQRSPR